MDWAQPPLAGPHSSTPLSHMTNDSFRTSFFHDKTQNTDLKTADLPIYFDISTENER